MPLTRRQAALSATLSSSSTPPPRPLTSLFMEEGASSKRKVKGGSKQVEPRAVSPSPKKKKKKKLTTKKTETSQPGSKAPPEGWQEIWDLMEELRADRTAPVDSDGAEALPQPNVEDKVYRFQILVALMLSSQTKDKVVGDAMRTLQKYGLTVENMQATTHDDLNAMIQKVGFHNNKTKYIKQSVEILLENHSGDIPKTAAELMELPGVGPKMAYIVENIAWGTQSGIGIDTHMHRMFNQLGWVSNTKNPEKTRIELEAWLPKEKWESANYLWVGFGQEVQQFKGKMLTKVVKCSKPKEALQLVKRLGLDYKAEAAKIGLEEEIQAILKGA